VQTRTSTRAPRTSSGLCLVAWLCLGAGCGGEGERRDEASASPASPDRSSSGGSAPASAPGSRTSAATPAASASSAGLTPAPAPADQGAAGQAGQAEPAADACGVLGADACGACVCARCNSELDSCLAIAGCAEILVCVRDSGCSGSDCYCGDATLPECLAGDARGPCREAVLAAPGGKAPSLTDPSAGPASDAALRVADCAEADPACGEVCGLNE